MPSPDLINTATDDFVNGFTQFEISKRDLVLSISVNSFLLIIYPNRNEFKIIKVNSYEYIRDDQTHSVIDINITGPCMYVKVTQGANTQPLTVSSIFDSSNWTSRGHTPEKDYTTINATHIKFEQDVTINNILQQGTVEYHDDPVNIYLLNATELGSPGNLEYSDFANLVNSTYYSLAWEKNI